MFKYVNENGKLSDKNRTLTVNKQCITSSIQEEVFLNDTYDEMTNYLDILINLIDYMLENDTYENEKSKVTFSLVFNDLYEIDDVDNDGSRNAIIDNIYTIVTNGGIEISKSDIRIIDISSGSVIVNMEIITSNIEDSRQIVNIITIADFSGNVEVENTNIMYNNVVTSPPVTISPSNLSLNEDSSCNFDLSGIYSGTGSIVYMITTLPNHGTLYKYDIQYVQITEHNMTTSILSNAFRYEPNNNYYGQDSFTYYITVPDDNYIQSGTATVNITIHGINDEPDSSSCHLSGESKQGSIIIANVSVTDDDNLTNSRESDLTFQWQYSDYSDNSFVNISGANDASYQIPNNKTYVNKYIRVVYTASDRGGTDISYASDASYVQNFNRSPVVNGFEIIDSSDNFNVVDTTSYHPTQGKTLDVSFSITDVDVSINALTKYSTDVSFNYQWYRNDTSNAGTATTIYGATDSSYLLTRADVDKYIYVEISYNDGFANETFDSSFTNKVNSHGDNYIYFDPSFDTYVRNITIDSSTYIDFSSVIDQFDDHNDISYRILARNNNFDWSNNYFNDLSGFKDWSLNTSSRQITVSPNYDTFLDQSNNWGSHIELRLEAYSISSPHISAIYTLKYQINDTYAPSWYWDGHPNLTLSDISQGSDFVFDLSVTIIYVTISSELDADLSISLSQNPSWISLDPFTYPNVKVTGTPSNEHVGQVSFTLNATYGTKLPVSETFRFNVDNRDDPPSPKFIDIMRNDSVLLTTDDICQNDVLDISFTINDIDVSTNSFNQNNISNFFSSSDKYQYQWYRDSTSISGATDSSYTLVQADVSCYIWVDISYTDKYDFSFDISSSKYGRVHNVNDLPTSTSNISFTVNDAIHNQNSSIRENDYIEANFTITDTDVSTNSFNQNNIGTFFDSSHQYQYQWYRDSTAITNATDLSYTLTSDDISSDIWFKISYTDKYNTTEDISKSVSTSVVQNYDTSSDLVITLSYEHLMIGYKILGTLNWSRIDEDGILSCEYQFQKRNSESVNLYVPVDPSWQTIPIPDIYTNTSYDVSMIIPDDTINHYIRLRVKEVDVYDNQEYFDFETSTLVSDWSYTGSTAEFFSLGTVVLSITQSKIVM